jgi:hypothetical protein
MLILSGTKIDDTYKTEQKVYTAMTDETLKDSSTFHEDCGRVQGLKQSPKSNRMVFNVLNISDYFPDGKSTSDDEHKENIKKMIKDIRKFWPTMIVLPFSSSRFANDPAPLQYTQLEFYYEKFDIIKEMLNPSLLGDLIARNEHCMIFKSSNSYQNDKCLLSSATTTSAYGLAVSIPGLLDYLKSLSNLAEIKVLIISGSHGQLSKKSGLNDSKCLEHEFYEETCELIGVDAQDKYDTTIP